MMSASAPCWTIWPETMYQQSGVGLAAVQVGVLRRAVVIDIGEGKIELVNPMILETSGSQVGSEGCLSFPGQFGIVERPRRGHRQKPRTGKGNGLK